MRQVVLFEVYITLEYSLRDMQITKGKIATDCGISPLTAMLHQKDGIQDIGHSGFPKKPRENGSVWVLMLEFNLGLVR